MSLRCGHCKKILPKKAFAKNAAKKSGYSNWCKDCYKNNTLQSKIKSKLKVRDQKIKVVRELLKNNPCRKCGIDDFRVLQFNHKHGKLKNISRMLNSSCSLDSFIEEIHKCEVICSNCHKMYTAKKQNWYRLRWYNNLKRKKAKLAKAGSKQCKKRKK